jgi:hypothetical protein
MCRLRGFLGRPGLRKYDRRGIPAWLIRLAGSRELAVRCLPKNEIVYRGSPAQREGQTDCRRRFYHLTFLMRSRPLLYLQSLAEARSCPYLLSTIRTPQDSFGSQEAEDLTQGGLLISKLLHKLQEKLRWRLSVRLSFH